MIPDDKFYNSQPWRRLRKWFINQSPFCAVCGKPGQCVDHIKPRQLGGESYDTANLQTLCNSCHAKKRQAEGPLIGAFQAPPIVYPSDHPENSLPPACHKFLAASGSQTTDDFAPLGGRGDQKSTTYANIASSSRTHVGLSFVSGGMEKTNRLGCKTVVLWGPPCAGKLLVARREWSHGDVIIDRDLIWSDFSQQELHSDPGRSAIFVDNIFTTAIRNLFARTDVRQAWIVTDAPKLAHRSAWAAMGAELRFIESTQENCLSIAATRPSQHVWVEKINSWFEAYEHGN